MSEFSKAKEKFEKRKAKVNAALPFVEVTPPEPKVKAVEQSRPRPKVLEVVVSGPVSMKFEIDWTGTLMGGQMNDQAMKVMLFKALSPFGRVILK